MRGVMVLAMTQIDPLLVDVWSRSRAAKIPIGRVMRRAGLRPATWSSWMAGASPALKDLRAVQAALAEEVELTNAG